MSVKTNKQQLEQKRKLAEEESDNNVEALLSGTPKPSTESQSYPNSEHAINPNIGYSQTVQAHDIPVKGAKSMFNEYAVFTHSSAFGDFNKLYDVQGVTSITPTMSRNPSAAAIIRWSQEGRGHLSDSAPYSFADFAYAKYYGHIPNNYMITLRRYPFPMLDNLMTLEQKPIPPLAQAITYMGEETGNKMSEFLKQSLGLNWDVITADVQDVEGNEKGYESSLGSILNEHGGERGKALSDSLKGIIGFSNPKNFSGQAQAETDYARKIYDTDGPYANKVYGPVNVVNQTMVRKRGLHHENEISLKFHFSARSIGSVNPKAAMLDLISNMLSLTYNNAKFWGGAIRYFPQHPQVPFFGDQQAFYNGDVGGYINSITKSMGGIAKSFTSELSNFLKNPKEALKKLGTGGGKMLMGEAAARDRPQILSFRSLLTGAPVGEWHLVVGNPMNPTAMIGNLVCTDVEMSFGDILGADDFPTEVEFTVKLKHGKPRDKGDIESMLNLGNGRLYHGINGEFQSASMSNSIVDTSGKRGNTNAGLIVDAHTYSKDAATNLESKQDNAQGVQSIWGTKYKQSAFSLQSTAKWADPGSSSTDSSKTK